MSPLKPRKAAKPSKTARLYANDRVSEYLFDIARQAASPSNPAEGIELLKAAAWFAVAEAVTDLAGWVRQAMETDREDWLRAQTEKRVAAAKEKAQQQREVAP